MLSKCTWHKRKPRRDSPERVSVLAEMHGPKRVWIQANVSRACPGESARPKFTTPTRHQLLSPAEEDEGAKEASRSWGRWWWLYGNAEAGKELSMLACGCQVRGGPRSKVSLVKLRPKLSEHGSARTKSEKDYTRLGEASTQRISKTMSSTRRGLFSPRFFAYAQMRRSNYG